MKDILILAHFTQIPGEMGNGRFNYIAEKLCDKNINVEIVTSSFSHRTKRQRNLTNEQQETVDYKITMVHEPSYRKNVSVRRFYSHFIFGKNLKCYLKNRRKPDVIYCSVPSLDAAKVMATYANENNIKFIIDIQDLWPEAFNMVFNKYFISDLIFFPMKKKANYIYSSASIIFAVSKTYLSKALEINKKSEIAHSVYLGTELKNFDLLAKDNIVHDKPSNETWIAYAGTLGHSYDLYTVIDAIKVLQLKGINNLKFVIIGDGPLKTKFEDYAIKQNINHIFTGRLDYGRMVGILKACDIAVNPIKSGSAGSIINKVGDYAAAGLPVINTQENQEYQELVNEYKIGSNCENENIYNISEELLILIENKELRESMGLNNRILAQEKFDREVTYEKIINSLYV